MADELDAYKEEDVWHCDRKITKLYYHCDLQNCPIYNDKQKWGLQDYNNHRKHVYKLPPIPERAKGRPRKDPSKQPKCIYKQSNYHKRSLDKEKALKHCANSKRRRALISQLSKHGVKLLTDLPNDKQKEVKDKVEEIMNEYESNENRQKRWIAHLERLHQKGELVEDLLAEAKDKDNEAKPQEGSSEDNVSEKIVETNENMQGEHVEDFVGKAKDEDNESNGEAIEGVLAKENEEDNESKMINEKGGGYNYNELKKWTKGMQLQAFDSIIVPIHSKDHWSLAAINFK